MGNVSEYNQLILQLIKAYLEINPDQRFNQALNNLNVRSDLYYEASEKTYLDVKTQFDKFMISGVK